jgi:hypothetical protein
MCCRPVACTLPVACEGLVVPNPAGLLAFRLVHWDVRYITFGCRFRVALNSLGRRTGVGNKRSSKRSVCRLFGGQHRKDDVMTRLLAFTALALSMGIAPVLAADTSTQPPTANTTSPEASKSATTPPSGSADTSGGATEQSSSPPSAGSTMGKMGTQSSPSGAQTTPNPSSKMGAQGSTSGGQTTPNPTAPGSND